MEFGDIKNILLQYGLNKPFSYKEIGIENMQSTYKVITKTQEYFLKISQRQFTNSIAITSRYHVMNNLIEHGIYIPLIVKDTKGNNFLLHNNQCVELFEWIDFVCYSSDKFYECIEDLCNVFLAYDNMDFISIITPRMLSFYKRALIKECENFYKNYNYSYISSENKYLLNQSLFFLKEKYYLIKEEINRLPIKYIHGDLNITNIAYHKDLFYLLDFDTTRLGLRIEDIALIFYDICIDVIDKNKIIGKTNLFIEKMRIIYPNISIDIVLFFLIKRLLYIISSQIDTIDNYKNSLILQEYLNGLSLIFDVFIFNNNKLSGK